MGNSSSHRRKHRQQSHTQSHAKASISTVLQGHPLEPTNEAAWISTNEEFLNVCAALHDAQIFAFDTEFIGEETYYPNTCLIQVATTEMVALIDPFKISDLTPLHELIANPKVTTIVHSGSQDLEPIARILGKTPASIFDTQIAAGLIGFPWPISLTKIIKTILNHDVGGHFTFSEWDARPLTKRQLVYAADDVRYLLAIHEHLKNQLEALGRSDWSIEEFMSLTTMESYQFNIKSTVKRICRTKNPKKKELQRIQSIVSLREKIAIEHNLPTRSIIPNECIISLARQPVDSIDKLTSLKGFSKTSARKYGKQIIDAIDKSNTIEPVTLRKPNAIEGEVQTRQQLDGAWALFGAWCVGTNLSPGLVANRSTFTDWFLSLRDGEKTADSPLAKGWRCEAMSQFAKMIQHNGMITFLFDGKIQAKSTS
ncbi:MAG: HRDC domain-containing protein [Planctomycetota bacterium]|nr:HRDC domain-containing protein [Planctomycetota bacterium]